LTGKPERIEAKNSQQEKLRKGGEIMQPEASLPMFAWYVWGLLIIGTFLMTLIGTWLIARRWEK